MTNDDRSLGMGMQISRRDFIHGASAAAGAAAMAGMLPGAAFAATGSSYAPAAAAAYPPLRTGLRGLHPGSFEPVHALAWAGQEPPAGESTGEVYDLVVVGGGLSGLAAAYYFRKAAGAEAKILILDNLQGVGGHAQRNEFEYEGKVLYANAGSSYMVGPSSWSREARSILDELGAIKRGDPRDKSDREMFSRHSMGSAAFFPSDVFGEDRLVKGNMGSPTAEFLAATPMSARMRADVDKLMNGKGDYLAGKTADEKVALLQTTSYRDYLLNHVGMAEESLAVQKGSWAMGLDTCTAWFAFFRHAPGFEGLGLTRPEHSPEGAEHRADDYTLPGGNSDVARLIIRSLIPDALPAGDVIEIADKRMDYTVLDRPSNATRIRQGSIVYSARHLGRAPRVLETDGREVEVSYLNDGRAYTVKAGNVVMACMNNVIPSLCPDMPETQKVALRKAVRCANLAVNVLYRNWEAFAQAGVSRVTSPWSFYGSMGLSGGRSFGGVTPPQSPSEPIIGNFGTGGNSGMLSNRILIEKLCGNAAPPIGTNNDEQYRAVRRALLATPFETFEREIRDLATRSLAGTSFDPARDIVAITVNRWAHGFATGLNDMFDPALEPGELRPNEIARRPFGRIAIANTDAGGVSTMQTAFDQAYRAVNELQQRAYGFYDHI